MACLLDVLEYRHVVLGEWLFARVGEPLLNSSHRLCCKDQVRRGREADGKGRSRGLWQLLLSAEKKLKPKAEGRVLVFLVAAT